MVLVSKYYHDDIFSCCKVFPWIIFILLLWGGALFTKFKNTTNRQTDGRTDVLKNRQLNDNGNIILAITYIDSWLFAKLDKRLIEWVTNHWGINLKLNIYINVACYVATFFLGRCEWKHFKTNLFYLKCFLFEFSLIFFMRFCWFLQICLLDNGMEQLKEDFTEKISSTGKNIVDLRKCSYF